MHTYVDHEGHRVRVESGAFGVWKARRTIHRKGKPPTKRWLRNMKWQVNPRIAEGQLMQYAQAMGWTLLERRVA